MIKNEEYIMKLIELGDCEGSTKELQRIITEDPSNLEAWLLLADLADSPDEKADYYRKVLQLDFSNVTASEGLKRVLAQPTQGSVTSAQDGSIINLLKETHPTQPEEYSVVVYTEQLSKKEMIFRSILPAVFGVAVIAIAYSFINNGSPAMIALLAFLGFLFIIPLILAIRSTSVAENKSTNLIVNQEGISIKAQSAEISHLIIPWNRYNSFKTDQNLGKTKIILKTAGYGSWDFLFFEDSPVELTTSAIKEWEKYLEAGKRKSTKPCKICGKEVSKTAQVCPHCGELAPGLYLKCPRCSSMNFHISEKGFQVSKAAGGALLFGPLGLIAGMAGNKNVQFTCQKCKYKWQPSAQALRDAY